ncbi:MAG TPA: HAD-IA family hydrolase [Solirubrobacteraceae bacterium]|nr:HAD-IA family hydrolase [Solirubrobacteraceae bacterium]
MSDLALLWDFDGTLATRRGMWSGCVLEVLDREVPGHGLGIERVREALRGTFPWHRPDEGHPELRHPDAWWRSVGGAIAVALTAAGVAGDDAARAARAVRGRYTDVTVGWRARAGASDALALSAASGAANVVVSNHVPELAALVAGLGLAENVDAVFTSAQTGYEKPHPEAFRIALAACADRRETWMIGDNETADVRGAEALGIPAVLVGARDGDLVAAVEAILARTVTAGPVRSAPPR